MHAYMYLQFSSHDTHTCINHISDTIDTNPLTTNAYRWTGIYPEHYNKEQIIVAPVLINPNLELPYYNINDNDFNRSIIPPNPIGSSINNLSQFRQNK